MKRKYPVLIVIFLLLVPGCASSPRVLQEGLMVTPLETTAASAGPSTETATPPILTDTTHPKFVPKQNDLIFIEFFAGT